MRPPSIHLLLILAVATSASVHQFGAPYDDTVYVTIQTSPNGPTNIVVNWIIDTSQSGTVTSYDIAWHDGDVGDSDGTHNVEGSTTTYTIANLIPCTFYTVTVQPKNGNDPLGAPGQDTPKTGTQAVLPVKSVSVSAMIDNSHQLDVSWDLVLPIGRCPGYYKITWSEPGGGEDNIEDATSFTITGLIPFTSYSVCVDSGSDAESLFDKPVCQNSLTSEDIPGGPPTNINIAKEAEDSLTVKWGPPAVPNGNIISYTIVWTPDDGQGQVETTDTEYTIPDLLPCSDYTITVSAATGKGSGPGGDISGRTLTKAPGPPTDVAAAIVMDKADSLLVTWAQAEPANRCTITSNTVTWRLTDNEASLGNATMEPSKEYTIIGLTPYTSYQACVRASTDELEGPYGICVDQFTDEALPDGPPTVRVSSATSNSLAIEWDPPATPNGEILNYKVIWSSNNDPSGVDRGNTTVEGRTHDINGLLACSDYTISVSAGNSKGYGPSGDTTNTTHDAAPDVPSSVMAAAIANQSHSLSVTWTQADPAGRCDVTNNTVTWYLDSSDDVLGSQQMPATEEYIITGLDPWTTYRVCVEAAFLDLISPDANCDQGTTDEDVPGPPKKTAVEVLSSTSILVTWEAPSSLNGNITTYRVKWISEFGETGEGEVKDPKVTTYTASGLKACTNYTFTVTASTRIGEGPESDEATDTTEQGAPPPPADVNCTNIKADSMKVFWSEPDTACTVTQYMVSYVGQVLWSEDMTDTGENSTNDTTIRLTSLVPWTEYKACVVGLVADLNGDQICCDATTDEAAPEGPPQLITVVAATSASLTVEWDPPAVQNGNITQYKVSWSPQDEGYTADTTYDITNLTPCSPYTVTISATTSVGYGPNDTTSGTTEPAAPDSVESLNVTQLIHDFGLSVTWPPVIPPGNCNLTYTVSWSLENGTLIGEHETLDPEYEIMDLNKNTIYIVCVTPSVEEETTEPLCDNETTIMTRLWLSLESSPTTINVSWFLVTGADSYRIVWNDGSGGKFKLVSGDVSKFTIDKLEPCNNYEVSINALAEEGVQIDYDADSVSTLPQEPSPVTSLNVTQEGDEPELTVTWPPLTPPGKCDLTYTVTWTWSANGTIESDQYDTTNSNYLITNLNYNTEYSVCVDSWVQYMHTTPACDTKTVIEKKLGMILEPASTSISVSWSLVDHADSYYIEWTDQHSGSWVKVDSTIDNYVITNLKPCDNYTINLDAQDGSSKLKSESNVTQTLPQATTPVPDLSLTQMIREPGLGVTWSSVPTPGYCNLNYKINWSHLDNTEDGHDTTTDLQYNITNLEYGTEYTVCVISSVEGEDAEEVCQTETTTDSRIGLYLESTSTTIHVYWNTIEGADSYYLSWTTTNDGAWTTLYDTDNYYLINDALPSSNYTVEIEAKSGEDVLEKDMRSILTLPEEATRRSSGRRDLEISPVKTKVPQPKTSQNQRLPPLALARFGPLD